MQEGHAAESEAPEAPLKLESSRGLCTWASYLLKEFGQAIKLSVHDLVNEIHEIETANLFITATLITSVKHFQNCLQIRTCQLACAQLRISTQPTLALLLHARTRYLQALTPATASKWSSWACVLDKRAGYGRRDFALEKCEICAGEMWDLHRRNVRFALEKCEICTGEMWDLHRRNVRSAQENFDEWNSKWEWPQWATIGHRKWLISWFDCFYSPANVSLLLCHR